MEQRAARILLAGSGSGCGERNFMPRWQMWRSSSEESGSLVVSDCSSETQVPPQEVLSDEVYTYGEFESMMPVEFRTQLQAGM